MATDLSLKKIGIDQYRQVAEWEFGPQPEGTDWERYYAEMNAPQWAHFGLYDGGEFIGCVSFERIDPHTMAYHVVTARHKVHPHSLAQVLLKSARFFFERGFTRLIVRIPKDNVAAARLAIRCGMREDRYTDSERHFTLIKSRYLKNGIN
jgi:RimJ/RimL family protein N-acetyltransferase